MPFINKQFIDTLLASVDITKVLGSRMKLEKAGVEFKGLCPFHNEKTPSFTVSPQKQLFHCFGCGEGGGALQFIMKYQHLGFQEAVEELAGECGLSVVYEQTGRDESVSVNAPLFDLMEAVNELYQQRLRKGKKTNKAIDYAKKRGLSGEIAKRFELGFAPSDRHFLGKHFKDDPKALENLKKLELQVYPEEGAGEPYDRFRNRLIFPIRSHNSKLVGFGGRTLNANSKRTPKYLNSSDTAIFSKAQYLYGFSQYRKSRNRKPYLLLVEGYLDVISLHQHGFENALSTLGTAMTEKQLELALHYNKNLIFCFDGDAAGRKAAWRAVDKVLPKLSPGMTISFLLLPDGQDPDSLLRKESPERFGARIDNARTLSDFIFTTLEEQHQLKSVEGRIDFLEALAVILSKIKYTLYASQLINEAAARVGEEATTLRQNLQSIMPAPRKSPSIQPQKGNDRATERETPIDLRGLFSPTPDIPESSAFTSTHTPDFNTRNTPPVKDLVAKITTLAVNFPSVITPLSTRIGQLNSLKHLLLIEEKVKKNKDLNGEALVLEFQGEEAIFEYLTQNTKLEFPYTLELAERDFIDMVARQEGRVAKRVRAKKLSQASNDEERRAIAKEVENAKRQGREEG